MPEGPELFLASNFIKNVCKGRIFSKICKSEISKNPPVVAAFDRFTIDSCSRGKEVKLILTDASKNCTKRDKDKPDMSSFVEILFTFGLTGNFDFCPPAHLQKHSHLCFYTADDGPEMVLSFVDSMRFGKWTISTPFSANRGPCVLLDYSNFRKNVLENVSTAAFKKPICEVLLNQKYFNGIGNYSRAEILYRHGTPPFVSAYSVLDPLVSGEELKVKSEKPDILQLCNIVAMEVVNNGGDGYSQEDITDDTKAFSNWLQCYSQDGMKNMADHNGRTIWFHGPAGPMAPRDVKTRQRKTGKKKKAAETVPSSKSENYATDEEQKPKRAKRVAQKSDDIVLSLGEPVTETGTRRKRQSQEPPKKVSRTNKQSSLPDSKSVSKELESVPQSISDLHSEIIMNSQYMTRGRLKSFLNKGDNCLKSSSAKTKTRARLT